MQPSDTNNGSDVSHVFNEGRDSFLNWFLISALTGAAHGDEDKAWDKLNEEPRMFKMSINDVPIDPLHAFKRLEEEYLRAVKDGCEERFEKHKQEILDPLQHWIDELVEGVKQRINDRLAGVQEQEYAYYVCLSVYQAPDYMGSVGTYVDRYETVHTKQDMDTLSGFKNVLEFLEKKYDTNKLNIVSWKKLQK